VDATHPFAAAISHHARDAAEGCGLPLVRLERPAWQAEVDDRWIDVPDVEAAVAVIPPQARILLTIGRKGVMPFLGRTDISGIARMIEPIDKNVTANWRILLERPPFHVEKELCLLKDHSVTHLVTKNSGGEETRAKLVAARMNGIPVVMIARPAKPEVATAGDPQAVLSFLGKWVSA
jgi:precorrin-6A/cobalt-precorrin-6A reductase